MHTRKLIDLSVTICSTPSEATPVSITILDYYQGARALGLEPEDFPAGCALSNEQVHLTSHTGTHMDAPAHYGPLSGGKNARTIEQIPLEWCYSDGIRLDVRHRKAGDGITRDDIIIALQHINVQIKPLDIVLIWTGCDTHWGTAAYLTDYPGMTREAVVYLVEQGVRVIGIDTWGLDRPASTMLEDYRRYGNNTSLWPAHFYGREQEYCQLEKLVHLEQLPSSGFQIMCFPIQIENAGAGWCRVVAVLADH